MFKPGKLFCRSSAAKQSVSGHNLNAEFQKRRHKALQTADRVLCGIYDELARGEQSGLELRVEHLYSLFGLVAVVDEAIEATSWGKDASPHPRRRAWGSRVHHWFLVPEPVRLLSHKLLQGHERLHLVTGIKVSQKRRTLDNMVKVALESASVVGALADQCDLSKTLIEMDEWGHQLHGLFHSHPGNGAQATKPSTTDLTTHERYESGGYPLVGAIFVKGFVRFFANYPFSVSVYGKGVEEIDTHVFAIRNLPH